VLLSWRGEVKLADFGVAVKMEGGAVEHPPRGGTAGYMSPEQARRAALDGRSDLYTVGIILWEILAGRRLFNVPRDVIPLQSAFRTIARPRQGRPGRAGADLEAVALRLLAYDRDERYPSAALAAADLLRCQDNPRDGRSELVRLLDERFPPATRARPGGPESGSPPPGPSTLPDTGE
jgi:serine/threonine-protein kinase